MVVWIAVALCGVGLVHVNFPLEDDFRVEAARRNVDGLLHAMVAIPQLVMNAEQFVFL